MKNIDNKTVEDFGKEWAEYSHDTIPERELKNQFDKYFHIVDLDELQDNSHAFDMGCGSGRWAKFVAPKVGVLHCIDGSSEALKIAERNLSTLRNCIFHQASFNNIPLEDASMDFGYSLGVLHHIPDTVAGLRACIAKLKPGAPFLAYFYYAFDNKPLWFKTIWRISDIFRRLISVLPFRLKLLITKLIALAVYLPAARSSLILERLGFHVENIPLSQYRTFPYYTMKTDALDRFGTRLEKRFTRKEIHEMFKTEGLQDIQFSDDSPYWCVVGFKQ